MNTYSHCMRWRGWLRHCATSRKVAGSFPNGIIGNFQPLTEMSTRNISFVIKAAGVQCDNLIIFTCRLSRISGRLKLLEPSGPVQACTGSTLPLYIPVMCETRFKRAGVRGLQVDKCVTCNYSFNTTDITLFAFICYWTQGFWNLSYQIFNFQEYRRP
jgi:hypothetical protein